MKSETTGGLNYTALRLSRTSMARAGQTGQQSSQALHLPASNRTSISGRLTYRAPVGQTAVQVPHW
jgi:hypothetical protein